VDQIKTGKFIAQLRRRDGLTQEKLGEKIGVTNKTVSRWENGNYMPDIEMLQLLGKVFSVSINELLAGQFLTDEEFRRAADENVVAVSKESAFSFKEKKAYFIKKWRRDHIALLVVLFIIVLAFIFIPVLINKPWFIAFAPLVAFIEYGYQHNAMMIYVENRLYGTKG
jgi:transcriptional regulator with XRE-family HTH domain